MQDDQGSSCLHCGRPDPLGALTGAAQAGGPRGLSGGLGEESRAQRWRRQLPQEFLPAGQRGRAEGTPCGHPEVNTGLRFLSFSAPDCWVTLCLTPLFSGLRPVGAPPVGALEVLSAQVSGFQASAAKGDPQVGI